ncbi:MAG: Gx transporter family protein [Candidatus Spyradocola sp.]
MRKPSARTLVLGALLAACALLVSYVESLFPLPLPLPGAKLGLSNAVVLLALLTLDVPTAFFVLTTKLLLSALLFGTPISLLYAAAGGLLAFAAMTALRARPSVSPIGQSIAGAVLHNLGQTLVAAALTATPRLLLYFTPLALLSILTGALSGLTAQLCARRLRPLIRK